MEVEKKQHEVCAQNELQNLSANSQTEGKSSRIDFSHAFATPHRLTVCLPDSSDKTLLDVLESGGLRMAFSWDDLRNKHLCARNPPEIHRKINIKPEVDGHPMAKSHWTRAEGWLPVLVNTYEDSQVTLRLEVVGGKTAAIIRVEITNDDVVPHRLGIRCEGGYNPAYVQPDWEHDILLQTTFFRADRINVLALGADEYPVLCCTLFPTWSLEPGEKRVGWIIRPFRGFRAQLPELRAWDWQAEFEDGKAAWRSLIARACAVSIPDIGVQNAWLACLADLFVMREEVADGSVVACPGTETYRSPEPFEPLIVSVLFDQVGLHQEAAGNTGMFLERQGLDGNWADPEGWTIYMWGASGTKSRAIMEHYRHTGDKAWLEKWFPRMLASSRWQETQRAKTRVLVQGERPLTYGLMPRGVGDCGLENIDGSTYGVFLPHNILAVYADAMTVEAAEILGRAGDLPELRRIHQAGLEDLLQSLDRGAIAEDAYRWIPGAPGHTCGSRWGALYAGFPCNILPPDHELISGTIRKLESRMSPGGIPLHTGFMKDGMWVAITLDNLAEVLLQRDQNGDADAAVRYLYATLNHGTPLYTWCEERGQEPGSKEISGDIQHLWTPVAVVRFIRDALVMEDGETLHLARGTDRHWLEQGKSVGIKDASTHFGVVTFAIVSDVDQGRINASLTMPSKKSAKEVCLHLRHPKSAPIRRVTVNGKSWTAYDRDKETVVLKELTGTVSVTVQY